jgi:hypothetical protein
MIVGLMGVVDATSRAMMHMYSGIRWRVGLDMLFLLFLLSATDMRDEM